MSKLKEQMLNNREKNYLKKKKKIKSQKEIKKNYKNKNY